MRFKKAFAVAATALIVISGSAAVSSANPPVFVPGVSGTEPARLNPNTANTVVTIKETCHELSGQEFKLANGTGRVDSDTVRLVFNSWLSGDVKVYVDGSYRFTLYLDRNLQNSGYPLTATFNNTRLPHDYDAYQTADLGFHYPNTPTGYQYTWSSTGIYGVVGVGANHCQTPKTQVG